MADKARQWTDKELEKMEKKIEKTYKQAEKETTKKWKAYMKESEKKVKSAEKAFKKEFAKAEKTGNWTQAAIASDAYTKALDKQLLKNKEYQRMVNNFTNELANVNQTAIAYLNDQMPSVYRVNYNNVQFDADNLGIRFDIVDEHTVAKRIKEGDIKLPYKRLDKIKDKRWNTKKLNSSVLQGILQGESMQKIADRIYPIVDNNKVAAIRNARTMVTGAENAGRLDSYKELEKEGLVMKKVWMATPDGRTRESHLALDGVAVKLDEEFLENLMYPADPDGDPAEVYNCRCSMTVELEGYKGKNGILNKFDKSIVVDNTLHEVQIAEEKASRVIMANQPKVSTSKAKTKAKAAKKEFAGTGHFTEDAYTQERKDEAFWARTQEKADNYLRPQAERVWKEATQHEKRSIYEYTAGSSDQNSPLRRSIDGKVEVTQRQFDKINGTTDYINRCTLKEDIWLNRGVNTSGASKFLDIPEEFFWNASQEEMEQAVLGKTVRDEAFFSCGSSRGSGFTGVKFNVYCPEGTKGAYCEPFSAFGYGNQIDYGLDWDGIYNPHIFGPELETLLQRGTEFRVIKAEKSYGEWFFDIEVIGQNPKELSDMLTVANY